MAVKTECVLQQGNRHGSLLAGEGTVSPLTDFSRLRAADYLTKCVMKLLGLPACSRRTNIYQWIENSNFLNFKSS